MIDRYIKNTFPTRIEIEATSESTEEMKCLYNTANRSQRIRYAHAKYKEGLNMQEIAYLLHSSVGTVGNYLAISENEFPEDKHIVRERQHQESIRKKENEMNRIRKL